MNAECIKRIEWRGCGEEEKKLRSVLQESNKFYDEPRSWCLGLLLCANNVWSFREKKSFENGRTSQHTRKLIHDSDVTRPMCRFSECCHCVRHFIKLNTHFKLHSIIIKHVDGKSRDDVRGRPRTSRHDFCWFYTSRIDTATWQFRSFYVLCRYRRNAGLAVFSFCA